MKVMMTESFTSSNKEKVWTSLEPTTVQLNYPLNIEMNANSFFCLIKKIINKLEKLIFWITEHKQFCTNLFKI